MALAMGDGKALRHSQYGKEHGEHLALLRWFALLLLSMLLPYLYRQCGHWFSYEKQTKKNAMKRRMVVFIDQWAQTMAHLSESVVTPTCPVFHPLFKFLALRIQTRISAFLTRTRPHWSYSPVRKRLCTDTKFSRIKYTRRLSPSMTQTTTR